MKIEWLPSFDTGIAEVDQDHRRLVSLINDLDDVLADAGELSRVGAIIDALVDYTDYHFKREEDLLKTLGYDRIQEHADIHASFGQFLGEMIGACMLSPSHETADKLGAFLRSWLVEHILDEDMKYVSFMDSQKEARA